MNRRLAALALLSVALPALAAATPAPLHLHADVQGVRTALTLRIDGPRVSGDVEESGVRLPLDGQAQGRQLQLLLRDPATALPLLHIRGALDGDRFDATLTPARPGAAATRVVFHKAGTGPDPAPAAGASAIDPRLVGRWVRQSMINSGSGAGGFASFTTERTLELGADGQVRQWVRSVGGGGSWSADGGRQLEFSGRWQARDGALWVQPAGDATFRRATGYRLAGAYLVTEGPGARQIWQR